MKIKIKYRKYRALAKILSAAKEARRSVLERRATAKKNEKGGVCSKVRARGRIRHYCYVGPVTNYWTVLLYEAVGSGDDGQGF